MVKTAKLSVTKLQPSLEIYHKIGIQTVIKHNKGHDRVLRVSPEPERPCAAVRGGRLLTLAPHDDRGQREDVLRAPAGSPWAAARERNVR